MPERDNPFAAFQELFERMTHQFEDAARTWDMTGMWREGETPGRSRTDTAGIDLADRGEEYVVTMDVPGYESDDIDCRLVGETVHVSGERERDTEEAGAQGRYLRRERRHRSFDRSVRLPQPVDGESVTATVNNGVLTVTLPKIDPDAEQQRIEIE